MSCIDPTVAAQSCGGAIQGIAEAAKRSIVIEGTTSTAMFALEEHDELAVLEEALAFIDGLDASAVTSPPQHEKRERPSRRRRDAAQDVRRRRRIKEHRLALRHEAEILERRLKILQQTSGNRHPLSEAQMVLTNDSRPDPEWKQRATAEAQLVAKAMKENERLRNAVAQQHRLLNSLRKQLSGAVPIQNLPSTANAQSLDGRRFANRSRSEIMYMLKQDTWQLLKEVDIAVVDAVACQDGVSFSLSVKVDPVFGPYSDRTIAMIVPRELNAAVALMECATLKLKLPSSDLKYNVQLQPSSEIGGVEKEYSIELETPGGVMKLAGIGYIRRYAVHDRVAVMFSWQLSHSSGLCFRERGWIVAVRLPSDPSNRSAIFSCYRLSNTRSTSFTASPSESAWDLVQNQLAARMRSKIELIHRNVLDDIGPSYLDRFMSPRGVSC